MRDARAFQFARFEHVDGRRQLVGRAPAQVDELLLQRREEPPRLVICLGREHIDTDHRVRLRPGGRRPVLRTVQFEREQQIVRSEMRRERERQSHHRGELRAEQARSEQPDRHVEPGARHSAHALAGHRFGEVTQQLGDVVGEGVGAADEIATQRAGSGLVGARRAAETEIDPAGIERGERAELLGDDERRVVRQHDATRADANRVRAARDMADHDGGRGTRDAGHVVMFGEPVTVITPAFGMLREVERVAERLRGIGAGRNGGKIKDGKRNHRREAFERRRAVMRRRNRCRRLCQRVPERAGAAGIPLRLTGTPPHCVTIVAKINAICFLLPIFSPIGRGIARRRKNPQKP